MRSILLTIGGLCSVAVVVVVGLFGLMSSDELTIAVPAAAWNVGVALGALGGLAVAQSAWCNSKLAAVFYALVWLALVAVNIGNSIGFLAVKGEKQDAVASHSASTLSADRATLYQKQAERARQRFEVTTQAQVDAAEGAARDARAAANQECGRTIPKAPKSGPGDRCERKDAAAAAASAEFVRVIGEKAKTDSAKALDNEIGALKAKIEAAAPETGSADSAQGAAFARIINSTGWLQITALDAESWRHFGLAMAFELLIICCFSAAELESRKRPVGREAQTNAKAESSPEPLPSPVAAVPARPRPKLAITNKQPVGAILDFLAEGLDMVEGPRTEMTDAFIGYSAWCKVTGCRALDVADFINALDDARKRFGIRVEHEGDREYLVNVQLAKATTAITS